MNFPCKIFGEMKIILYLCTSFFERRISLTSIINVKVKIMTNDFSEDGMAFVVDAYLSENYDFRRNVLSGKTEMKLKKENLWRIVSEATINTIVRKLKLDGLDGSKSPRQDVIEYLYSDEIEAYDPIRHYLTELPEWDGNDHVGKLFSRLPGLTEEHLEFLRIWLRSAVVHWLQRETLHGNELMPVLIGDQGCGKSTFAVRLLPEALRCYYLDHIHFGNNFSCDMALTNNLLVNIDEFANMGPSKQGALKYTLSRNKVNSRPIFGRTQEDKPRYASFIATTNDVRPLCDTTGSRRYLCISIPEGELIDNDTPIDYDQLYAQVMHEIDVEKKFYWLTNAEEKIVQDMNMPYLKIDSMETMLHKCFRKPKKSDGDLWMSSDDLITTLRRSYPIVNDDSSTRIRLGATLKSMGYASRRTRKGRDYNIVVR